MFPNYNIYLCIRITFHYHHKYIIKIQTKEFTKIRIKTFQLPFHIINILNNTRKSNCISSNQSLSVTQTGIYVTFSLLFSNFLLNCSSLKQKQNHQSTRESHQNMVACSSSLIFLFCFYIDDLGLWLLKTTNFLLKESTIVYHG